MPECFELEPGEKLTLIWNASESGDAAFVSFIKESELIAYPGGEIDEDRSWTFKHR